MGVNLSNAARLYFALPLLAALAAPSSVLRAQERAKPLPEVIDHGVVSYPPLARQARIQGHVRLRVTTNGHTATDVTAVEGHPLLVQSAEQNVRTWKFVDHSPGTFDVTFNFRMLDKSGTFLQEPGVIEVVESPECCIDSYTLPEKWITHVRNAEGTIVTPLTLWIYHSFEQRLDGYTTGPQGRERDVGNPHIDGDMLGFDTALEDKYGQRLKFSMIGKMSGDKIKGVFLNYWGAVGTWTAERSTEPLSEAISAQPANSDETPVVGTDVAYHENPEYSNFTMEAGIQGAALLRVKTDGYSVTNVAVQSGNPFLAREAIYNLQTWRFTSHIPRTFDVTYSYQLLNSKVEFLKEPGVVEIDGVPPLVSWYNGTIYTPPDIWLAQFASSHGVIRATFSFGKSNDMPDGYVIDDAADPAGMKREEIRQAHQDGDILGFDATVKGPGGRPLKISVLGRRTKNKITGVFLDYSGTPGTWTAVRQPSHKPTKGEAIPSDTVQ